MFGSLTNVVCADKVLDYNAFGGFCILLKVQCEMTDRGYAKYLIADVVPLIYRQAFK